MLHFLFLSFSNVLFLSISNVLFLSIRYSEIYFLFLSTRFSIPFLLLKNSLSFQCPQPRHALSREASSAEDTPSTEGWLVTPGIGTFAELVGNPRDVRDSSNTGSVTGAMVVHPERHGVKSYRQIRGRCHLRG